MSNKSIEYNGFTQNGYAMRKNRLCVIKKIDFTMHPPSVVVKMCDTGDEIGTEFEFLNHAKESDIKSKMPLGWYCNHCSSLNKKMDIYECLSCHQSRNYDEQILYNNNDKKNEKKNEIKINDANNNNNNQSNDNLEISKDLNEDKNKNKDKDQNNDSDKDSYNDNQSDYDSDSDSYYDDNDRSNNYYQKYIRKTKPRMKQPNQPKITNPSYDQKSDIIDTDEENENDYYHNQHQNYLNHCKQSKNTSKPQKKPQRRPFYPYPNPFCSPFGTSLFSDSFW